VDHVARILNGRRQGGGHKEIVPTTVIDGNFFATGYTANWISMPSSDPTYAATIAMCKGAWNTAKNELP
jgi:hypothetical protein